MSGIDALKRLGVELLNCSICGTAFKVTKNPQWFVIQFIDAEPLDDDENPDPFCSEGCAKQRASVLTQAKNALKVDRDQAVVSYVAWPNRQWNP